MKLPDMFKNKKCKIVYHSKEKGDTAIWGFLSESQDQDYIIVETPSDIIKIPGKSVISITNPKPKQQRNKKQREPGQQKKQEKHKNRSGFSNNFSYKKWWKDNNIKEEAE